MAVDAILQSMMLDTVTRYPATGVNANGEPTHSATGTALPCRITYRTRAVFTAGRAERVSTTTIIFPDVVPWSTRDKLVLPDGSVPVILHVQRFKDERGVEHEQILT